QPEAKEDVDHGGHGASSPSFLEPVSFSEPGETKAFRAKIEAAFQAPVRMAFAGRATGALDRGRSRLYERDAAVSSGSRPWAPFPFPCRTLQQAFGSLPHEPSRFLP